MSMSWMDQCEGHYHRRRRRYDTISNGRVTVPGNDHVLSIMMYLYSKESQKVIDSKHNK